MEMSAFQRTLVWTTVAGAVVLSVGQHQVPAFDVTPAMHLYATLHGHTMVGWSEYVATPSYRVLVAQVRLVADPKQQPVPIRTAVFLVQRHHRFEKLGVAHADKLGRCTLGLDTRRFQIVPQLQRGDKIIVCDVPAGHVMCGGPLRWLPAQSSEPRRQY